MGLAKYVATRSTCLTIKIGAIAVKDKRVLATGYNAPPSGTPHCVECKRDKTRVVGANYDDCPAVHAEVNCLLQAARFGIELNGATVYCTAMPCNKCFAAMINAGIKILVTSDTDHKPYMHDEMNWQRYIRIRKPYEVEPTRGI